MESLRELETDIPVCPERGQPLVDEHVVLLGRPPLNRFLEYVEQLAVDGRSMDIRAMTEEWHAARSYIRQIAKEEFGWYDSPPILPLPPHLHQLQNELYKDPVFLKSYRKIATIEVGMVELEKLVVYQRHIDLTHVARLKDRLGPSPSEEAIFKCCLPFNHPMPEMQWMKSNRNTYVFVSSSNDIRFLESTLLTPENLVSYQVSGAICGVVGAVIGYSSNFLHAIQAENRLILNNGGHRAYALRDLGVTHVPCIIKRVANREELRAIAPSDLRKNVDLFLKHPRPSVLKDYFNPRLRKVVTTPRRLYQIKVSFDIETMDIPAM